MKISASAIAALSLSAALAQTEPEHVYPPNGWIGLHGVGTVAIHSMQPDGKSAPVAGRPFSGTEVRRTRQTLADGTHVDQTDSGTLCRDAQGRTRSETSRRILIYDPVAGFIYNLDKSTKTYEKYPIDGGAGSSWPVLHGPHTGTGSSHMATHGTVNSDRAHDAGSVFHADAGGHSTVETLPPQVVNGVGAKGSKITTTVPEGAFGNDREIKIINEHWYSETLEVLLKSSNSDPRFGITTYDLTGIRQTTPDPGLFQAPSDYRLQAGGHHQ